VRRGGRRGRHTLAWPWLALAALLTLGHGAGAQPLAINPSAAPSDVRNPSSTNPAAAASDISEPERNQPSRGRLPNPSAERALPEPSAKCDAAHREAAGSVAGASRPCGSANAEGRTTTRAPVEVPSARKSGTTQPPLWEACAGVADEGARLAFALGSPRTPVLARGHPPTRRRRSPPTEFL
jgi:hypothetical protein